MLFIAGLFLGLYAASLTISQGVLARAGSASLKWDHWIGVGIWIVVFAAVHRQSARRLTNNDPFILPIVSLLSGWGMLTIWSILPAFGLKQAIWLLVCGGVMIAGFRLPGDLNLLRRYKYIWLTGSILLTGLTLLLGVNPLGYGPKMWLGCCGQYFQPSEILKLLLLAFLAGYIADRQVMLRLVDRMGDDRSKPGANAPAEAENNVPLIALMAPSLVMLGLATAILVVQRDLGTAFIFLFLYTVIVYTAFPQKKVLLTAFSGLVLAGFLGYRLYDVIRIRVDAWINPWLDPSGSSYQIVQGLLAIANGGLIGRGPGLGNPEIVPLAHSDLIFAAAAEQTGLIGVVGMLALILVLAWRALKIFIQSSNAYHRCLAVGISAYLAGQSLLIIGGTLRLLPLTGITLPFVSYGGSSLVVSMMTVTLLLILSQSTYQRALQGKALQPVKQLGLFFGAGIFACALAAGWWSVYRSPALLTRTDNPRRTINDRYVRRGSILDRNGEAISESRGEPGSFQRWIDYPPLSNIIGFTNPTYGQSGLEASLDEYLRGTRGNPFSDVVWNQAVYGQPPDGLDVRLTIDLGLQRKSEELLGKKTGALVVINPENGEILAMSSSPSFDANRLDEGWETLTQEKAAPLFNRATLGRYPVGMLDSYFPGGLASMQVSPTPPFDLPTGAEIEAADLLEDGSLSPLQAALAAAAVSAGGVRPEPQLVSAIHYPDGGWTPANRKATRVRVLQKQEADRIANQNGLKNLQIWQITEVVGREGGSKATWYLGGRWASSGDPGLAVCLVLEEDAPSLAVKIGQALLVQP